MPPPIQPIAERFPALEKQAVELTFFARDAHVVEVAGTFNNWCPAANPLARTSIDEWSTGLMLEPGQNEYLFVVDGQWKEDPLADQSAPNAYGGRNSVLNVRLDARTDLL